VVFASDNPRLVFRPESFFLGRTEGEGVVQDLLGRRRRCRIATHGIADGDYDAVQFQETFHYDDGERDEWQWVIARGFDGRYIAREGLAGPGLVGRIDGDDYCIAFRRPARPGARGPAMHYRTRFTLLSPETALKRAQVSLFGLPVASMTAFHRRQD
jgi:hypothetical protein